MLRTELYARDVAALKCNVYARADGNVVKTWKVPEEWKDKYILMGAYGGNIFVLFGVEDTDVVDPTEFSVDDGLQGLIANPKTGDRIAQDSVERLFVPKAFLSSSTPTVNDYFSIVGDTADTVWFAFILTEYAHIECQELPE